MDALRDENEENQKAIDLQKARYELQRSMNQRTKLMFNGDQFVYSADSSAVRDNWENVEALELEQTISSMEKEKEALQELISELDRYKNLWAEISGSYQDDQDREAADSILGENFGQEILLNRLEDIEAFRDRYVAAQSQIDDNTNMIESYEEKLLYYDSLGVKWDEISSLHEESINRQLASEQFGAEWETLLLQDRLAGFEEFRNSYLGIQEQLDDNTLMIASYNEKIAYYQDLKEQWASIADTCQNSVEDQYASMILGSNWEADVLSGRMDTLNRFKNDYVAIQLAMAQADVDRYNIQVEAASNASKNIKTSDASISNGPQVNSTYRKASSDITTGHSKRPNILLKRFGDGGVITDSAAGSLDWLAQMAGEDHIIIASNNERVLTEGQNQLFEKLGMSAPPVIANPIKDLPRFTFPEPQREKSLSLHIGEINMNNVQDVDGFARAIERELPLCMLQMLHTK